MIVFGADRLECLCCLVGLSDGEEWSKVYTLSLFSWFYLVRIHNIKCHIICWFKSILKDFWRDVTVKDRDLLKSGFSASLFNGRFSLYLCCLVMLNKVDEDVELFYLSAVLFYS